MEVFGHKVNYYTIEGEDCFSSPWLSRPEFLQNMYNNSARKDSVSVSQILSCLDVNTDITIVERNGDLTMAKKQIYDSEKVTVL